MRFSKYINKFDITEPKETVIQLVKTLVLCLPVLIIEIGRKIPLLPKKEQASFYMTAIFVDLAICVVRFFFYQNLDSVVILIVSLVILIMLFIYAYSKCKNDIENNEKENKNDN